MLDYSLLEPNSDKRAEEIAQTPDLEILKEIADEIVGQTGIECEITISEPTPSELEAIEKINAATRNVLKKYGYNGEFKPSCRSVILFEVNDNTIDQKTLLSLDRIDSSTGAIYLARTNLRYLSIGYAHELAHRYQLKSHIPDQEKILFDTGIEVTVSGEFKHSVLKWLNEIVTNKVAFESLVTAGILHENEWELVMDFIDRSEENSHYNALKNSIYKFFVSQKPEILSQVNRWLKNDSIGLQIDSDTSIEEIEKLIIASAYNNYLKGILMLIISETYADKEDGITTFLDNSIGFDRYILGLALPFLDFLEI